MSSALAFLVLVAGAAVPATTAPADTALVVPPEDRRSLTLTLYGQGFGLVTDVRRARLEPGRVRLDFADVAPELQESTVRLETGAGPGQFRALEQGFRRARLTPASLLEAYVGREVRVYPRDATGVEGAPVEAELLSTEGGRVLRMDGRVTFDVDGRLSFPEVPRELDGPPTLSWLLDVDRRTEELSVSYLTDGVGWSADYVLTLAPDGDADGADERASLAGWVELRNGAGTDWPDARIQLVAGDVRRASGDGGGRAAMAMMEAARADAPGAGREELFAYHRYSLERQVTLPAGSTKRVSLLEADGVEVTRRYEVRASSGAFRNQSSGGPDEEPVNVVLELENTEERGLGMPLPAGVVRVYAGDGGGDGATGSGGAFLGEDRIGHTPEGETLELVPGRAFDLTAVRVQTHYEALGRCASESAWEIRLRNAREEAAQVRLVEPVSGEWEILESSHAHERVDAGTFRFDVEVPGEGTETVRYRIRVSWC